DGKVYSASYAAVHCIQKAGSRRKTANGWIMWKTKGGEYLRKLYEHLETLRADSGGEVAVGNSRTHSANTDEPTHLATPGAIETPSFQKLVESGLLSDGQPLTLEYGPRGGERRTFAGLVRQVGIEVDGKVYSPSYAAVYCIQKAGSKRKTANGWIMWK